MQCLQPNFGKRPDGLIPAIAVDFRTMAVLMVAWVNARAFRRTLATGLAHYWSTSDPERRPWLKGATSGNYQRIVRILVDCDGDVIVYVVQSAGPACHTGQPSCFYRDVLADVAQAAFPTEQERLTVVDVEVAASLLQKGA